MLHSITITIMSHLDILVMNRTSITLTNLTVDLATKGPLKIVERPQSYTLAPGQSAHAKVTIKVSSTETSNIFGNIVFDTSTNVDTTVLNLNDINIDIMDYIRPASASDVNFRAMWAEFEWENKVACNTDITNVQDFVNHIGTLRCCVAISLATLFPSTQ
jgi:coatomer subunit beta